MISNSMSIPISDSLQWQSRPLTLWGKECSMALLCIGEECSCAKRQDSMHRRKIAFADICRASLASHGGGYMQFSSIHFHIYILYILVWGVTDVRASCMPKIVEHDAVVGIQWMHLDSHWMPMMRRRLEPLAILAQHSAAGPCQARYFADLL